MLSLLSSRLISKSAARVVLTSAMQHERNTPLLRPWSQAFPLLPVRRFLASTAKADVGAEEELSVQDHLLLLENEVEMYFRHLAESKASTPGIQKILNRLADDEAMTYRYIESLSFCDVPSLQQKSEILQELRPIFQIMSVDSLTSDDRDEIKVYERARDAKGQLRDLYLAKAKKCHDPKGETLLRLAAKQADKHYQVLDETVEYLAKAEPGSGRWAECAEFFFVDNSQFDVSLAKY